MNHRIPPLCTALPSILVAMALFAAGSDARAKARPDRTAAFFIEPSMGMAMVYLRAVEIEGSFVTALAGGEVADDWENVDPSGVVAPVGRMISYQGRGMEMAITSGIKISGLRLGIGFSWINAAFSGYSKRYRYMPELLRAGGRTFYDASRIPLFRILASVKYGIPIRRLLLHLQTRIGAMVAGDTPLVVGRAVEQHDAVTVDFGLDLTIRPVKWVSFGVLTWAGAFAFPGTHEGAMGFLVGFDALACVYF